MHSTTDVSSNKFESNPSINGTREFVENNGTINENGVEESDDCWEYEEITLIRGPSGLGFTVAGGTDNPHYKNDSQIYITRIIPNGKASSDGRLKLEDIIVKVDGTDLSEIKHSEAVAALKNSEKWVKLLVKRRKLSDSQDDRHKSKIDTADTASNNDSRTPPSKIQDVSPRVFTSVLKQQAKQSPPSHQNDTSSLLRSKTESLSIHDTKQEAIAKVVGLDDRSSNDNNKVRDLFGKNTFSVSKSTPAIVPSTCITKAQRKVILHRSAKGLGFNIVGDLEGGGIFISYLVPDGPAGKSNKLHCGDQIISVNGVNLRSATHEQAANTLKQAGQTVKLIVKYRPDEYMKFESKLGLMRETAFPGTLKTSTKLSLYARALFDYDPSKDSGLPSKGLMFKFGDILHIINASDDEWWQAKKVLKGGQDDIVHGIIPSKKRVEKRERARLKSVKFFNRNSSESTLDRRRKRFSFTKKFPYMKSREDMEFDEEFDLNGSGSRGALSMSSATCLNYSDLGSSRNLEEAVPSYEPVLQREINYARPLALIGPVKEELESLRDDLGCDRRFSKMEFLTPCTTKPPQQGQADGGKYHFISREEMKRNISSDHFIEVKESNGHLYGTTIESIKELAQTGKHCLLNVAPKAIRKLYDADMYPIVILIKPKSIESLLEMNKRWSQDEAIAAMDFASRLEQEYNYCITATVQKDNINEIVREVINIVSQQSGPRIWIPTTFDALEGLN